MLNSNASQPRFPWEGQIETAAKEGGQKAQHRGVDSEGGLGAQLCGCAVCQVQSANGLAMNNYILIECPGEVF